MSVEQVRNNRNEYEWISHTGLADSQGVTTYRHKMSGRAVLIFTRGEATTVIWLPPETLRILKERF